MRYTFQFKLFGSKVQMFHNGKMGIVIEKERDVVCVYGTDEIHQNILCAIPLCHPRFLKGVEYIVDFCENQCVKIQAGDFSIVIDFVRKKCANNQAVPCYGSDLWGQDVAADWNTYR